MPLFGSKKPTAKEAAKKAQKDTKREVRSAQRDLDRELRALDRQEKEVMIEIKKRAKTAGGSNDAALKALAKNLVQVRKQREKLIEAKAHMGAVGMQATSMASQVAAASAVGSVTQAMGAANSAVDAKQMQKTMNEFTRQNEMMGMKEEMMDDALADAFDNDAIEEEADEVTAQVLAELGVELDSQMAGLNAPNATPAVASPEKDDVDALPDLRARLDAL